MAKAKQGMRGAEVGEPMPWENQEAAADGNDQSPIYDDPAAEPEAATPDLAVKTVDEMVARATAAFAAEEAAANGYVLFVTTGEVESRYDMVIGASDEERIRGTYDSTRRRLLFRVPVHLAERFARHERVVRGVIMKVGG